MSSVARPSDGAPIRPTYLEQLRADTDAAGDRKRAIGVLMHAEVVQMDESGREPNRSDRRRMARLRRTHDTAKRQEERAKHAFRCERARQSRGGTYREPRSREIVSLGRSVAAAPPPRQPARRSVARTPRARDRRTPAAVKPTGDPDGDGNPGPDLYGSELDPDALSSIELSPRQLAELLYADSWQHDFGYDESSGSAGRAS